MSSKLLFINCHGVNNALGSIWVGGFIFKQHPRKVLEVVKSNLTTTNLDCLLTDYLEVSYRSVAPSQLDCSYQPIARTLGRCAESIISSYQLTNNLVEVINCDPGLNLGTLNLLMLTAAATTLESKLTAILCKRRYQSEVKLLAKYYPKLQLLDLYGNNYYKQLALCILVDGNTFGVRTNFLRQVPVCWLDLLRLGIEIAYTSNWFAAPPLWWSKRFKVPFYFWYSQDQLIELTELLLQFKVIVDRQALLKLSCSQVGAHTLLDNFDLLTTATRKD